MAWTDEEVAPGVIAPDNHRPGFWTWAGLTVVWGSAAVLSFAGLRDLAVSCHVSPTLAPLLPVTIDVGAAVSTRAWLSKRAHVDAERFARLLTWAQLGLTVLLNAMHQGMLAHAVTPPWQIAVLIGAIPAGTVGATVHLAVLLGRGQEPAPVAPAPAPVVAPPEPVEVTRTPRQNNPPRPRPKQVIAPEVRARAEALLEEKPETSRRTLAEVLGLSDYHARTLLGELRPTVKA